MGWKWLRRREPLAFGPALWHRALLDRPDRLTRALVEHEQEPLFGRLDDDVALPGAGIDAGERRLGRQIVVPHVVMHGLKGPDQFARLGPQRDHRVCVLVVARPGPAPKIR